MPARPALGYSALLLCVNALSTASAQDIRRSEFSAGVGLSVRSAELGAGGGNIAFNGQLAVRRYAADDRRYGVAAALGFDFFTLATTVSADCAPESLALCVGQRSLTSIAPFMVDALARPAANGWITVSAGPGIFVAATDFSGRKAPDHRQYTALGLGGGIAVMPPRGHVGTAIRTRWFPAGIGEIRALTTGSLILRF